MFCKENTHHVLIASGLAWGIGPSDLSEHAFARYMVGQASKGLQTHDDALIAVQVARRYVRRKRSSILEMRVVLRQHAATRVVEKIGKSICKLG